MAQYKEEDSLEFLSCFGRGRCCAVAERGANVNFQEPMFALQFPSLLNTFIHQLYT